MGDTAVPDEHPESAPREQRLAELSRDPHPAAHRAALAVRYPAWGASTLLMLVAGVVVGYLGLRSVADACRIGQVGCVPADHPLTVVLPVAGLLAGLVVSLIGGRILARTGRSPMAAALLGWAIFLVTALSGLAG
jgi:hypothetical protein